MSKPMSAEKYLSQLKRWGVAYRNYKSGWSTHNRTADTGKTFTDVKGIVLHHTGSDKSNIQLLWEGRSDLPGPLCQAGNDPNGLVWNVGWGYCNHAGKGDDDVLKRVIAEDYVGVFMPNEANTDGNARFYGMEVEYSGSHGMGKTQYHTMIRWCAAICEYHEWTAKSVIGHGEWQPGKWDPGYATGRIMDMNAVRNDIADLLKNGPGPVSTKPEPRTFNARVGDKIVLGGSVLKVMEVK